MLHLWAYPCQGSELRSKSLPSGHVMSLPSALHLGEKPSEQMQSERHTFMYLTISLIEMAVPSWHTRSDWGLLVYGHHGIPPLEHPTPVCFFTDPSPTHLHWNKVIKDLFYNAILVLVLPSSVCTWKIRWLDQKETWPQYCHDRDIDSYHPSDTGQTVWQNLVA